MHTGISKPKKTQISSALLQICIG